MILLADGNRKYPHSKLLASSADRGWSSIYAEVRTHPAGRLASTTQPNVEIVIALHDSKDGVVTRTGAGRHEQTRPTTGTIWLVPAGICHEEIELSAPMGKTLHLYLLARQFDLLAEQYDLPKPLGHSVQYLGGLTDELIHQIGLSVLSEMTQETSTGRMFAESAAMMLAAQLSHTYIDPALLLPGASRKQIENVRLRRVLDYIDQNLENEISVADLADIAALSTFHFARLFTALIGLPPRKYVSRRRLEGAMKMLAGGKLPLTEIAHRSRFSSQAAFSRAFRRATGVTPGEYRRIAR
jgi:AraC family transcriptional regulator